MKKPQFCWTGAGGDRLLRVNRLPGYYPTDKGGLLKGGYIVWGKGEVERVVSPRSVGRGGAFRDEFALVSDGQVSNVIHPLRDAVGEGEVNQAVLALAHFGGKLVGMFPQIRGIHFELHGQSQSRRGKHGEQGQH